MISINDINQRYKSTIPGCIYNYWTHVRFRRTIISNILGRNIWTPPQT